ncbi:MAG: discoidin domain-containing protein [Clostridia bacterium]|nr:discoidin domain-containing protein [Clostridia bacterium]
MENRNKMYLVANAHLDTQWLWTIQDTIRDCIKSTLEQNFELFSKYRHYHMNFEGAFRYKLAREYYPDLYRKLKDYIAQDRWSVAGSMIDAVDANVPSSEALMRQILYGNGFFEKEFGKRSCDVFLPDCFGFRYSLPSIARHMGLKGFSTQKLDWGVGSPLIHKDGSVTAPMPQDSIPEDERLPQMDLGKWTGPDGNSIAVSLKEGPYTYNFNWGNDESPLGTRESFLHLIKENERLAGVPVHSMYYGTGDYGGSCDEISAKMLDEAIENNDSNLYEIISASTDQIFRDLSQEQYDSLPNYDGGLLIPHGSGAITSKTINKRWNRKNELLADSTERAAVMAQVLAGTGYPADKLNAAWEKFLWHQFHDDLPGTSIPAAYVFSHNDYAIALNMFASELRASVRDISAAYLDTCCRGIPVVVYNPLSSGRTDVVRAEIDLGTEYAAVFSPEGTEVPSQVCRENGKAVVVFVAQTPAVSCSVYEIRESTVPCSVATSLKVTKNTLENGRYRITLDDNGDIGSIIDLAAGCRELLSAPSGFEIGPDSSVNWPSWELVCEDGAKPAVPVRDDARVEILENGPAEVSLKVTKTHNKSVFEQIIRLWEGGNRIDVDCHVEWFETASNLRAVFPLTVANPEAEFDLGLGAAKGGNTDSFPYYQHVAHQWADLTAEDGSYGVSIFNDCKYGMDKPDDNTLRLTLIHTPLAPFSETACQNYQDLGTNLFSYSIMGHAGARSGDTTREAAQLNQKPLAYITGRHKGKGRCYSLASVSDDSAIIRCIKKEEKGSRIIIRVQETSGRPLEGVVIRLAPEIVAAAETNGYEEEICPAVYTSHEITTDLGRYQVRTFAVEVQECRAPERPAPSPVDLEYTDRVTTVLDTETGKPFPESAGISDGISIPEELWNPRVISSGIEYRMGPHNGNNVTIARNQIIKLPEGTKKVSLLAASRNGDKEFRFGTETGSISAVIRDYKENVGSWVLVPKCADKELKRDEIAYTFSHTNGREGVRLYEFAYLFRYEFDVSGSSLTLPDDSDLMIFAADAHFDDHSAKEAYPVYDRFEKDLRKNHVLRIVGVSGKVTEMTLAAGATVLIKAVDLYSEPYLFDGWDGECVAFTNGPFAIINMPDHDTTICHRRKEVGHDVILGKPAKASHEMSEQEAASVALNGNIGQKWYAHRDDGILWLEADAEKPVTVGSWYIMHAGLIESLPQNAKNFRLEYRLSEDDEWKTADSVEGNDKSETYRSFPPVTGRYFRLWLDTPTQGGWPWARVYMLQIYQAG